MVWPAKLGSGLHEIMEYEYLIMLPDRLPDGLLSSAMEPARPVVELVM